MGKWKKRDPRGLFDVIRVTITLLNELITFLAKNNRMYKEIVKHNQNNKGYIYSNQTPLFML